MPLNGFSLGSEMPKYFLLRNNETIENTTNYDTKRIKTLQSKTFFRCPQYDGEESEPQIKLNWNLIILTIFIILIVILLIPIGCLVFCICKKRRKTNSWSPEHDANVYHIQMSGIDKGNISNSSDCDGQKADPASTRE